MLKLNAGTFREVALSIVGSPYVMGAENTVNSHPRAPKDCSEAVQYVYIKAWGLNIVDGASAQFDNSRPLRYNETLRVGDLGFKSNTYKPGVSHVCMYIGDGWTVEAKGQGDTSTTKDDTIKTPARVYAGSSKFSGWRRPYIIDKADIYEEGEKMIWTVHNASSGRQLTDPFDTESEAIVYALGSVARNSAKTPGIRISIKYPDGKIEVYDKERTKEIGGF